MSGSFIKSTDKYTAANSAANNADSASISNDFDNHRTSVNKAKAADIYNAICQEFPGHLDPAILPENAFSWNDDSTEAYLVDPLLPKPITFETNGDTIIPFYVKIKNKQTYVGTVTVNFDHLDREDTYSNSLVKALAKKTVYLPELTKADVELAMAEETLNETLKKSFSTAYVDNNEHLFQLCSAIDKTAKEYTKSWSEVTVDPIRNTEKQKYIKAFKTLNNLLINPSDSHSDIAALEKLSENLQPIRNLPTARGLMQATLLAIGLAVLNVMFVTDGGFGAFMVGIMIGYGISSAIWLSSNPAKDCLESVISAAKPSAPEKNSMPQKVPTPSQQHGYNAELPPSYADAVRQSYFAPQQSFESNASYFAEQYGQPSYLQTGVPLPPSYVSEPEQQYHYNPLQDVQHEQHFQGGYGYQPVPSVFYQEPQQQYNPYVPGAYQPQAAPGQPNYHTATNPSFVPGSLYANK